MSIYIKKLGSKLVVKFSYSVDRLEKIKSIEGYRWDKESKEWILPYSEDNFKRIRELFKYEQIHINSEKNNNSINLIKIMDDKMKLKGYSSKTRKVYINHINRFASSIDNNLNNITSKTLEEYILHQLQQNNCSHAYVTQIICAVKFFSENVLNKYDVTANVPRPKKEKKLPNVLGKSEIKEILSSLSNEKHKTLLFLAYSAGLRVGEVVKLKIEDIDSKRMLIHIRQSKGRKDRYTILSSATLEQLRKYYIKERPEVWLFPNRERNYHITERTAEKIFENACLKCKINKKVSFHSLRHYVELNIMVSIAFFLCIAL